MVVAARALPVGTVVSEQDVKTIEWSGGALPVGYIGIRGTWSAAA